MKMNLSVVMQSIDKMSVPLKKITSTQSKYSKPTAEVKKQSAPLSGEHELIKPYLSIAREGGAGIIGGEFANDITRMAKRLSEFVRNNKAEIVTNIKALIQHIKAFGKAFLFISQHIPEVIAAIALLKIGIFALNASMLASPLGLMVAGIAVVVVVVGYLLQKVGWLVPALNGVWEVIKRLGLGVMTMFAPIIAVIVGITNALMKLILLLPASLLPDSWQKNIKSTQQYLEGLGKTVDGFMDKNVDYIIHGDRKETVEQTMKSKSQHSPLKSRSAENGGYGMLRHPTVQSKSQVDVRIKSDKPVEIVKAESDKHTEMNVDTFDLLGWSL